MEYGLTLTSLPGEWKGIKIKSTGRPTELVKLEIQDSVPPTQLALLAKKLFSSNLGPLFANEKAGPRLQSTEEPVNAINKQYQWMVNYAHMQYRFLVYNFSNQFNFDFSTSNIHNHNLKQI